MHIHNDINISLAGQVAAQTARAGGDFPPRIQRETGANTTTTFHYLSWSFHSLFHWFQAPILAEIRREVSELKRKEAEAEAVATDKIPGIWTKLIYCVKGYSTLTYPFLVKDESGSEDDEKRTAEDQSLPTVKQEPPDVDDDKEVLGGESLNKPEAEEPKVGEGKDQVEEETPKGDVKEEPQDERHQEAPAKVEGQGQDENVESQGQDEKAEGSVAAVKTESEERQSRSPSSESSPSETAAVAAPPLQEEEEATAKGGNALEQGMSYVCTKGHEILGQLSFDQLRYFR